MARKKTPGASRGKNLVRKDGYIINQFGVRIPEEQARQLENAVRRVNRHRQKQIDMLKGKPVKFEGRILAPDQTQLMLMGKQADMLLVKRSASLHQFTSKKSFNDYLKSVERASKIDYLDVRYKQYKKNLMETIRREFKGYEHLTKGILMKIQMTPPEKVFDLVSSDATFEISNQYHTRSKRQHLLNMRDSLGFKRKEGHEDDLDEEYFEGY